MANNTDSQQLYDFNMAKTGSCGSCDNCTVRHFALCSPLETDDFPVMESMLSRINLSPSETLFYEADAGDYVYTVTSGYVKLYKTLPDGRCQITGFLMPGDFLGLAPQGTHNYTAQAITSASLCRFWRHKLSDMFNQFPAVEKRLFDIISQELLIAQNQMLLLGRKTSREKVTSFILDISKRAGRLGFPENIVYLPMTRSDIADYLGLTTESVSRVFSALRKDGLIENRGKDHIEIMKPQELTGASGEA